MANTHNPALLLHVRLHCYTSGRVAASTSISSAASFRGKASFKAARKQSLVVKAEAAEAAGECQGIFCLAYDISQVGGFYFPRVRRAEERVSLVVGFKAFTKMRAVTQHLHESLLHSGGFFGSRVRAWPGWLSSFFFNSSLFLDADSFLLFLSCLFV